MAYSFTNSKGTTYYLHTKKSTTSTGKERTLFYFSKELREGEHWTPSRRLQRGRDEDRPARPQEIGRWTPPRRHHPSSKSITAFDN